MMPLAPGNRHPGPTRGLCRDGEGQACTLQRLRWLWPKQQRVGAVEAETVGKGSSWASLSFEERVQRP